MFEVSIHLLCTRKSGTLSRLIREIKLFGLQYQSHNIVFTEEQSSIIVYAAGELNCTRESLIELFENLPEVIRIQKLSVTRDGAEVSEFKTTSSKTLIGALEPVTPAILLTTEKRMSEIMGPIASFLVENAANNSRNVGELYRLLSEELNEGAEKQLFLSYIDHSE